MAERVANVILIDDEEVDQMLYERVLRRSGLVENIHAFTYAEDALTYLRLDGCPKIDLIFLDINMPRMNGFEFLEAVTQEFGADFTNAVIVMLTTSLNPEDRARAQKFGIVRRFINKPLTEEHVRETVSSTEHYVGKSPTQNGSTAQNKPGS